MGSRASARLLFFGAVYLLFSSTVSMAAGAPAAALNKTIRISFGVTGTVLRPGEIEQSYSTLVSEIIYVSSAGRIFSRHLAVAAGKRGGGGKGRQMETGPDNGSGNRKFYLTGTTLVGQISYASGARLINATFDAGFTTCSASVREGRENGNAIRRRGPNGSLNTIRSSTISSPSCSIAHGNAFAGG